MVSALDQQEVVLMWSLMLCGQPEKLQDPLGQESMYCKQMLPLKRGNDLVAETGNMREGSALTGVRMGRC